MSLHQQAQRRGHNETPKLRNRNLTVNMIKYKTPSSWGSIIGLAVVVTFASREATAVQASVTLGSAVTFGVLAGTTVTTIPTTTINGDLGVFTGNSVSGAPIVNGTLHLADPTAAQAQSDLTIAYNDAASRTLDAITVAGNLGGLTLAPGLYTCATSLEISSGDLTLDALGNANAVWIFQAGSTLVTTSGRQVILSGGAQAANVFWQVGSSATIGTTSVFKGTIMADQSITMDTGATLDGRALARIGAVALAANIITLPNTVTAPVILVSTAVLTGSFTDTVGQAVNLATKTITVPQAGSTQYFRLRSDTALTITSISISGGNVVITYN
jgi:hypothetical protein